MCASARRCSCWRPRCRSSSPTPSRRRWAAGPGRRRRWPISSRVRSASRSCRPTSWWSRPSSRSTPRRTDPREARDRAAAYSGPNPIPVLAMRSSLRHALAAALSATALCAHADEPIYGAELQGFDYPYPLHHFSFASQNEYLQMAYMDVEPAGHPNGRTAVLMHGKNFCGATWEHQVASLAQAGWRVVVPDQVGFCASSKPARYQSSFEQLARNTRALLASLDIARATLVAHSTGGMIATRYALMWPQAVE